MPRVVTYRAPGCMVGGWQCRPLPCPLLRFELVPATMLIPPANGIICKEHLACRWLGLKLSQPVVFTERLVGACWSLGKNGCEGRKERASPNLWALLV